MTGSPRHAQHVVSYVQHQLRIMWHLLHRDEARRTKTRQSSTTSVDIDRRQLWPKGGFHSILAKTNRVGGLSQTWNLRGFLLLPPQFHWSRVCGFRVFYKGLTGLWANRAPHMVSPHGFKVKTVRDELGGRFMYYESTRLWVWVAHMGGLTMLAQTGLAESSPCTLEIKSACLHRTFPSTRRLHSASPVEPA